MEGFKKGRELAKIVNYVCEDLGFLFTYFEVDYIEKFGAIPDEYIPGFIASLLNVTEGKEDFSQLEELIEDSLKAL